MIVKIRKVFKEVETSIEAEKIIFAKDTRLLSIKFGEDETQILMNENFVVKSISDEEKVILVMNE